MKLWMIPFQYWRTHLGERSGHAPDHRPAAWEIEEVVWAVEKAGRCVPRATCLVKALAAREQLARLACPARLWIGVARGERGQLEAHAWLEHEGHIILGESEDRDRFVPFPALTQRR